MEMEVECMLTSLPTKTLNGEPSEEVDWFKYLESQVAADGGCERDVVHRMNERHRALGAMKSVLSN